VAYEALKKIKPDIIMASISGYGHTGPHRHYMAYGPAIPPLTGLSFITGYEGGPPQEVGMAYVLGSRADAVFEQRQALLKPFGIVHFYTDAAGVYERHLLARRPHGEQTPYSTD
jgi:hypothetical protein